jgi:hypothetical protein
VNLYKNYVLEESTPTKSNPIIDVAKDRDFLEDSVKHVKE